MRFGLLGTGYWAEATQGAALAAHPVAELTGVWGRDPIKAAGLAGRLGTAVYADLDDLLVDVDAVAIALPPHVQAPLATRAAKAGKHLLLDKPLALDPAAADEVVAAVRESGVASVVFFTHRFLPEFAGALAAAEKTGGWLGADVTFLGSIYQPGSPYKDSTWRHERGGLWDVGPHALARLIPVLGPVREVTAFAGVRGTTHVLARHESGVVSEMTLTLDAPPAVAVVTTTFYGEAGVIELPSGWADAVAAFGTAIDELMAQAAAPTPDHPCDAAFAAGIVHVLAAAQESVESGRPVAVH
jgi:predicted dehydrogenase